MQGKGRCGGGDVRAEPPSYAATRAWSDLSCRKRNRHHSKDHRAEGGDFHLVHPRFAGSASWSVPGHHLMQWHKDEEDMTRSWGFLQSLLEGKRPGSEGQVLSWGGAQSICLHTRGQVCRSRDSPAAWKLGIPGDLVV